MTANALLHHLFPWEVAPGVARDDRPSEQAQAHSAESSADVDQPRPA